MSIIQPNEPREPHAIERGATMYRIATLNNIAEKGLNKLDPASYEISEDATSADAILVRSHAMHDMELPSSLKAIARAGAGVNNIPIDRCTDRGIVVFNTPGANANSVKELVIAGMLLASRDIYHAVEWAQSQAGAEDVAKRVEKNKKRFAGPEILGKRLGVVGLGAVGVNVANAAVGLGMDVVGFDPFISVESAWGLSRAVGRASGLDELFSTSDYITLHVPLNDNTRHMVSETQLRSMKQGVRLLNFARGGLVDDSALIAAIKADRVAAYVTDFPEAPLLGVDGVIPIPHLGASTPEAEENCAVMAATQVSDFLETGNIRNSVNFPECRLQPSGNPRLLITNRNIPNMVGQITTVLAGENINILDLLNRHRDQIAYNIIDMDKLPREEVLAAVQQIDGVICHRVVTFD